MRGEFESFLDELCLKVLAQAEIDQVPEYSGTQFQALVLKTAKEICEPFGFSPEQIAGTGVGDFPDIVVAQTFGIEVKVTKDDNWISLGNSINESRRVQSVQEIHLLFGKMGGVREVRHRKYEQVLSAIKSTHFPRYVVDMAIPLGQSIFDRLGTSYSEFLSLEGLERIRTLKRYLRETLPEGEVLWWMDDQRLPAPGQLADGILRNLNKLSTSEKIQFRRLAMILTPQIFGPSPSKYNDVAIVLAKEFQAVTGNLRDYFSAGGKGLLELKNGVQIEVPKIVFLLCSSAKEILALLNAQDDEKLREYWRIDSEPFNRLDEYVDLLDNYSNFIHGEVTLGSLFRQALD